MTKLLKILRRISELLFLFCLLWVYAWLPSEAFPYSKTVFFFVSVGGFLFLQLLMVLITWLSKYLDSGQKLSIGGQHLYIKTLMHGLVLCLNVFLCTLLLTMAAGSSNGALKIPSVMGWLFHIPPLGIFLFGVSLLYLVTWGLLRDLRKKSL